MTRTAVSGWVGWILAGLLAGCTSAATSAPKQSLPVAPSGPGAHVMKVTDGFAAAASPSAHLTYEGGRLLDDVKVYTVFWGSAVQFQDRLNQYYAAVTNSPYMDWLSEYDTNGYAIGRGSLGGSFVDPSPPAGSTVDDSQISAELTRLISAGTVPAPDANSLYMFHFPPGVAIAMGGSYSCQAFCAYHSTTQNGVPYGVIPDIGSGGCENGCGNTGDAFSDTTTVASHELIEAVTDPDVGIGSIGWYDDSNGEIGDICVGVIGSAVGYDVQKEWSNQSDACIDHRDGAGGVDGGTGGGTVDGGTGGTVDGGTGGSGGGTGGNLIVNGDFEAGAAFTGWSTSGVVFARTLDPHAGTYCARVGSLDAYNGYSTIAQRFVVPATGRTTLTFYYQGHTSDSFTYDQQSGYLFDDGGNVLTTFMNLCEEDGSTWKSAAVDLTPWAGQAVTLELAAHDDGYAGDPTYLLVDDVAVTNR